jgi:anti-sigma factor RsiW
VNARFRGPCLDPETVTALADGELDHARREAVHQHLVVCSRCRTDVEGERRAKRTVQSLAPLTPSADLVARLHEIAGAPDRCRRAPLRERRSARARRQRWGGRRHRPGAALTSAASVAVFLVGGAAFLGSTGSPTEPSPPSAVTVVPAADRFTVEHAATSVESGLGESALTTVSTSFVTPAQGQVP